MEKIPLTWQILHWRWRWPHRLISGMLKQWNNEKGHKKTGNLGGRRVWPNPKSGGMGTTDSSHYLRKGYKIKWRAEEANEGTCWDWRDIEVTCWGRSNWCRHTCYRLDNSLWGAGDLGKVERWSTFSPYLQVLLSGAWDWGQRCCCTLYIADADQRPVSALSVVGASTCPSPLETRRSSSIEAAKNP